MQRGEMLTGRSVSAGCRLRIAECGFQAAGRRDWIGRLVLGVVLLFVLAGFGIVLRFGFGASAAQQGDKSADSIWQKTKTLAGQWVGRSGAPESAVVFRLDESALRLVLAQAPFEETRGDNGTNGNNGKDGSEIGKEAESSAALLWLPMPKGEFARFRIVEAPVMKPELAAQFPDLKSYRGWGVDNPLLTMRCDLSPLGFHATVTDGAELMVIHPVTQNDREHYVSYSSRNYAVAADAAMCLVNESKVIRKITPVNSRNSSVGTEFRDYDIAIATTGEYAQDYGGGTVNGTMSSVNSWLTQLNLIYERELSIWLVLVGNNSQVIYTNPDTDPFTNGVLNSTPGGPPGMVDQVRSALNDQIGSSNYDFGLVFGTGASSGSAYVGVVCETASDSYGTYKGGGAVLVNGTTGNPASVALMAHEIGHQFGATHTQNANCGNRTGDTAFESGSGLTLMSSAGTCGADNIATSRSSNFHSGSFEQIIGYLNALGGTCATVSPNNNNPPTVDGGLDYIIPKNTPFTLTATASDPDAGDTLTYSWEQVDAGGANYFNPPYSDAGDPLLTTRPIFRPFDPVLGLSRTFPSLADILSGQNAGQFENLPQVGRALNFRVTARDGRGGVSNDSVRLDVDGSAGPFVVTEPNTATAWTAGQQVTVNWQVAGTNSAPINCANMKISLSTDGGNSFSILIGSTLNDGVETFTLPGSLAATTQARIKVEAVGNIFFDISDVNFTVIQLNCVYSISPSNQPFLSSGGSGSVNVTSNTGCAWTAVSNAGWITIVSGASGSGAGTVNYTVAGNNTGIPRVGTMTIAEQTFTVNQSAGSSGLVFYPLSKPIRLFDTRAPIPGFPACEYLSQSLVANQELVKNTRISCDGVTIPATAQAIVGNATVVNPSAAGFITIWPDGQPRPPVSNLNFSAGQAVANAFTVGLSSAGNLRFYSTTSTELFADIIGYFAPPAVNGLYYHPLPKPIRLFDTRAPIPGFPACEYLSQQLTAGNELAKQARITCDGITIPSDAQAIVGNATVVGPAGTGFITLWPDDQVKPFVSNLNYVTGQVVPNAFTVRLSNAGQFRAYSSQNTDFIVDIAGYYSPSAVDNNGNGLLYSPLLKPIRLFDTRAPIPGFNACEYLNQALIAQTELAKLARITCDGVAIPANAQAIIGNATIISPVANGFATLWPDGQARPPVSNLNYTAGQIIPNSFTVGLSSAGWFRVYSWATTDLAVDVNSYYSP